MLIEGYGKAIVKRLQRILPYNVNIINTDGLIIASTDPERIGSLHQGGLLCTARKQAILITAENLAEYPGCKEGINLPVLYKEELIGVVGITGEPAQVESLGLVIKEIVELMLAEYDYQTKILFRRESAVQSLFEDILLLEGEPSPSYYEQKAKSLNISLLNNILVLGELRPIRGTLSDDTYLAFCEELEPAVRRIFQGHALCALTMEERQFVLILPAAAPGLPKLNTLSQYLKDTFSVRVPLVVSESCREHSDYHRHYVRCRKILKMHGDTPKVPVILENEYTFDLLMDAIPADEARRYIEKYNGILHDKVYHIDDAVIQTLKDFFENDMSITKTAASSHLHKNTITYRLRKVREAFPEIMDSTYEFMKLYIAIQLSEGQKH